MSVERQSKRIFPAQLNDSELIRDFVGDLPFNAIDMTRRRVENTHLAGGVPERPKGTDCKSVGSAFGGSNPPPSTIFPVRACARTGKMAQGG